MANPAPSTPRKHPKQRRSQATVDAILEAAARVLVTDGYDKASTNRIAKVAGVSVGSLYQYFPNKDAILLTLVERHCESMLQLLAQHAISTVDAPIPVAVRTYVKAIMDAHTLNPELHNALIHQVMHVGINWFDGMQQRAQLMVRAWLETHRDEILPDDLDVAAYVLTRSVEGIVHSAVIDDPTRLASPALLDETVGLVVRYLLGAGAEPAVAM